MEKEYPISQKAQLLLLSLTLTIASLFLFVSFFKTDDIWDRFLLAINIALFALCYIIIFRLSKKKSHSSYKKHPILNHLSDIIISYSSTGDNIKFDFVSDNIHHITGYKPYAFQTANEFLRHLSHPDDLDDFRAILLDKSKRQKRDAIRWITKTGNVKWLSIDVLNNNLDNNKIAIIKDITDTITNRREFKSLDDKYNALFFTSPLPITIIRFDNGEFVNVNDGFCDFSGYSKNDVIGKTTVELKVYGNDDDRITFDSQLMKEGYIRDFRVDYCLRNNRIRHCSVTARLVKIDGILYSVATTRDLSELTDIEQALRESQDRLRNIIEDQTEYIARYTPDGTVSFVNPAICRYKGVTPKESLGDSIYSFVSHENKDAHQQLIKSMTPSDNLYHQLSESIGDNAVHHWIEWTHRGIFDPNENLIEVQSVGREITEQKRLQEQLLQSQKMESLGRLAGGIAHDFNNLLTGINGHAELIKLQLHEEHEFLREIDGILDTSDRAAALIRQLLSFSRKGMVRASQHNLNSILRNMERMLRRIIGEDHKLILDLFNKELPVFIDASQMEQVVLNLVVNAKDAMPTGGIIYVTTSLLDHSAATHRFAAVPESEQIILLSVKDEGTGIPKEIQDLIFDPFFTTKPEEKGTGLGLATAYAIVHQSFGQIFLESEENIGTTFQILLPFTRESIKKQKTYHSINMPLTGSESILVIEDDENVGIMLEKTLNSFNYSVHVATNSDEAIDLFRQKDRHFDLLLVDVMLPGMNGTQLAAKIRKQFDPNLKVIYMSGYARDTLQHATKLDASFKSSFFIAKPFKPIDIAVAIRQVLDANLNSAT